MMGSGGSGQTMILLLKTNYYFKEKKTFSCGNLLGLKSWKKRGYAISCLPSSHSTILLKKTKKSSQDITAWRQVASADVDQPLISHSVQLWRCGYGALSLPKDVFCNSPLSHTFE